MVLKIFLDDKSFHCLKQSIPPGSHSKLILDHAVHLNLFGSNAVVSCDVTEARNLLLYAGHCPGVVASVHKALRSAGLTIDGPTSLEAQSRACKPIDSARNTQRHDVHSALSIYLLVAGVL
jgi:hypothetical protein